MYQSVKTQHDQQIFYLHFKVLNNWFKELNPVLLDRSLYVAWIRNLSHFRPICKFLSLWWVRRLPWLLAKFLQLLTNPRFNRFCIHVCRNLPEKKLVKTVSIVKSLVNLLSLVNHLPLDCFIRNFKFLHLFAFQGFFVIYIEEWKEKLLKKSRQLYFLQFLRLHYNL